MTPFRDRQQWLRSILGSYKEGPVVAFRAIPQIWSTPKAVKSIVVDDNLRGTASDCRVVKTGQLLSNKWGITREGAANS